ncbi:MAG: hypothetical protein P4L96_03510 [Rhodoferax sp.]|nr:hypothetical protein [Rhodoferax sp.]
MLPMNEIDKPLSGSTPMTIQRIANIERARMLVESRAQYVQVSEEAAASLCQMGRHIGTILERNNPLPAHIWYAAKAHRR